MIVFLVKNNSFLDKKCIFALWSQSSECVHYTESRLSNNTRRVYIGEWVNRSLEELSLGPELSPLTE